MKTISQNRAGPRPHRPLFIVVKSMIAASFLGGCRLGSDPVVDYPDANDAGQNDAGRNVVLSEGALVDAADGG